MPTKGYIPKDPNDRLITVRMFDEMLRKLVKQQVTDQAILTGWKDIGRICGVTNHTIKRWAYRYKMPYARIFGKPTIARVTLIEWMVNLCKEVAEGRSEEDELVVQRRKNLEKVKSRLRKEGAKNV